MCLWITQELVKHTQDAMEKENLRLALDAMRVSGHTWRGGWSHKFKSVLCNAIQAHGYTMGNPSPTTQWHTCLMSDLSAASPLGAVTCCGHHLYASCCGG